MTEQQGQQQGQEQGQEQGGQQDQQGEVPEPQTWRTGDEPPTSRQQAYLETLAREAGTEVPDDLTKAEASAKIDELREQTGRD